MTTLSAVAAWWFPWPAFGILTAYVLGRLIYAIGYTARGPGMRVPGALLCFITIFAQLVLSIVSVGYALDATLAWKDFEDKLNSL